MKTKNQILLIIILCIGILTASIMLLVSNAMNTSLSQKYENNSAQKLTTLDKFIDNFVDKAKNNIQQFATSKIAMESINSLSFYGNTTSITKIADYKLSPQEQKLHLALLKIAKEHPEFFIINIANKKGGYLHAPDPEISANYNPTVRPWFIETLRANSSIMTDAYISIGAGPVCTITAPVPSTINNQFAGVASVDISLETITKEASLATAGNTGYALIFDNANRVICDPVNSGENVPKDQKWLGKKIEQLPKDISYALNSLLQQKTGFKNIEINGKMWRAGVLINKYGWKLIFLQQRAEIFHQMIQITISIFLLGLIISATTFSLILILTPNWNHKR